MVKGIRVSLTIVALFIVSSTCAAPFAPCQAFDDAHNAGQEIVTDTVRNLIYLAIPSSNEVRVFNGSNGEMLDSIIVGPNPRTLDISPDFGWLYVAVTGSSSVAKINLSARTIDKVIALSFPPHSVQTDGRGYLYLSSADLGDGEIRVVEESTGIVIASSYSAVMGSILDVSPDGSTLLSIPLWVTPSMIEKYRIGSGSLQFQGEIYYVVYELSQAVVDWRNDRLYLACSGPDWGIEVLNISTGAPIRFLPLGDEPTGVALTSDSGTVFGEHSGWVDWGPRNRVVAYNTSTFDLQGMIQLPSAAIFLTVSADSVNLFTCYPFQCIPLNPTATPLYPEPGSHFGYTPSHIEANLTMSGLPPIDETNSSIHIGGSTLATVLTANNTLIAFIAVNLSDGAWDVSVGILWRRTLYYCNWSFIIDRIGYSSYRPRITPLSPAPGFSMSRFPNNVTATVFFGSPAVIVSHAEVWIDGAKRNASLGSDGILTGNVSDPLSITSHRVVAVIYWAGESASVTWDFTLEEMVPAIWETSPSSGALIECGIVNVRVSLSLGFPPASPASTALRIDGQDIQSNFTLMPNGTSCAVSSASDQNLSDGNHTATVLLNWQGRVLEYSWHFTVDKAIWIDRMLIRYTADANFTILVPNNWTMAPHESIGDAQYELVLRGPILSENYQANVLIACSKENRAKDDPDYLRAQADAALSELVSQGLSVSMVGEPSFSEISNHTAIVFTLRWTSPSIMQKIVILVDEGRHKAWLMMFSIGSSEYQTYAPAFDRMILSFEIKEEDDHRGFLGSPASIALLMGIAGVAAAALFLIRGRGWSRTQRR